MSSINIFSVTTEYAKEFFNLVNICFIFGEFEIIITTLFAVELEDKLPGTVNPLIGALKKINVGKFGLKLFKYLQSIL